MELNIQELSNESKKIKLEILQSLKNLNDEILNNDYNRAVQLKDPLEDLNVVGGKVGDGIPDVLEPINIDITDAKTALDTAKTALVNAKAADNEDGANDATEKLAVAAAQKDEKEKRETLERLETDKRVIDNYLTRWTRMDLFPGITRENVYPRTAMERTERRDFLGKGTGKVYPFGLKNEYQMSGVGGSSSDIIRLRRLYGRANYWKKRNWNYPN